MRGRSVNIFSPNFSFCAAAAVIINDFVKVKSSNSKAGSVDARHPLTP